MYTLRLISTRQALFTNNLFFFLQAHYLDPTRHYLRLKFLMENQEKMYIPKPDEDVCDLVRCSLFQLKYSGFYLLNKHKRTQDVTL